MTTGRKFTAALLLFFGATLTACDVRNPLDGVDVRLAIHEAKVDLSGLGALPLVVGQVTERTSIVDVAEAVKSLDAVHGIKLDPAYLTFTPAVGDATAASAPPSGTVLVALRAGHRPLLAVIVTVTDGQVTGIDPRSATLEIAVAKIRQHAVTAEQALGAGAPLGDWQSLTAASLLATLESILSARQSGLTLVALPLSGNLSGHLRVSRFVVDATVTAQR